jgi:hypothetical protein
MKPSETSSENIFIINLGLIMNNRHLATKECRLFHRLKNVACKTLWPVLKKNSLYNNSSLYIINHDGHRICPSSVQLSEGSTLGPPLPVKTYKHRFLKKL